MAGSATKEGYAEYRPRAGTLTLMYLNSVMARDVLRSILAQVATGVDLVDPEEFVELDDAAAVVDMFSDPYFLEPVDPDADQGDPETQMTPTLAGREVPLVAGILQQWLSWGPQGEIVMGEGSGEPLWSLLSGWTATIVHAFAGAPATTHEAQERIGVLDLEQIEARVALLVDAGLLEPLPMAADPEGEDFYEPTRWLRQAVAPLAVAARLELRHPPGDTAPIAAQDVEAALLLTLPLAVLLPELSGACSLSVELDPDVIGGPVGITVQLERGRVVSIRPGIDDEADSWAIGSASDWLDTVIEPDVESVTIKGEKRLAQALLTALHRALFEVPTISD